ncbi:MAG: baseplate J/gp47 family protein [Spirochaetaceae bacterium]|jgi:hypothetical protein|nr:baseplate J/gp47 family protein [Spirochaetaceae bacterium]
MTALALSLGLPPDDLSRALAGFIRFFALPLEPGLVLRLRREALSASPGPKAEGAALAAAAAAAKGLGLTGEALAAYAAALDPGYRDPPEGEKGGGQNGREPRDTPPEPGEIKKTAEDAEAASPLLRIMNRIPGKNRERWVVIPFSFASGGVETKASLRILLTCRGGYRYEAERLALDVKGESRRWLFALHKDGEGPPRTDVYLSPHPEGESPEALEREIREALGPIGGAVTVKPPGEMPFFADSRDDALRSLNKEV